MPKSEKVKVNVKERVTDNVCDLSLSELNEVPVREITTYKRVTVLDLSSNRLITLGKNFTSLTRLVKLDLSKNQIKYLPEDFGLLRNLKHLDLYDNKLEHLPLSFGDLSSLRYLDLKGNPLTPALAKIVGFCLTTKDCQDSAKNTVKFLAQMQLQAEKAKDQYIMEALNGQEAVSANKPTTTAAATASTTTVTTTTVETNATENQTTKKSNNKKSKAKQKNKTSNNNSNKKDANAASSGQKAQAATVNVQASKPAKAKKSNGKKQGAAGKAKKGSTALTSIFVFCFLLGINVAVIYMIMFKNPEIADKLVEFIPHQYRDWILSKTEFFRLRVTDWITEFRTQPEEH